MHSVAIIPARGGSRGIPRKNVALLDGKPLIVHTIDAARSAHHVDEVIVTTDDPEIAQISEQAGAWVVERPVSLAVDTSTSESAVLHALDVLREQRGISPEITVFLQCTSPLTIGQDIDETILAMTSASADCALAVAPCHQFLWKKDDSEGGLGINHDHQVRQRRQDRSPQYVETGAVYVMRTEGLREACHRFFGRIALHIMPRERVWEIDDPTDMVVARALLESRRVERTRRRIGFRPGALVLDFDGVFTPNTVLVFQDGTEAVLCNRGDGAGLESMRRAGIPLLVLSAERNPVVSARCRKLDIPCIQGVSDKRPELLAWLHDHGIEADQTIYIGNDLADIPCMQAVGCGVAVADAESEVLDAADIVLRTRGGKGAIRELVNLILAANPDKQEVSL